MNRCEDYPACGHDICPDLDPDTGEQLNMRCVCGAEVPLGSRFSLCESCLRPDPMDDDYLGPMEGEFDDEGESDYGY